MSQQGPIIVIDDDTEDLELIKAAFNTLNLKNDMLLFDDANKFLDFLQATETQPFFILCDVNMDQMNGFELQERIFNDERLRVKSIPFLFLSTSSSIRGIHKAYSLSVQGYFKKADGFHEIISMLKRIIEYWEYCLHPNSGN